MTTIIGQGAHGDKIFEIQNLHGEILSSLRTNLDKAIRIGELLTEIKAGLPHGGFGPWCEQHLPFTDRTARNYMRLHRDRDRLKTETVSDLKVAYKLLTASTKEPRHPYMDPYSDNMGEHHNEDWEPGPGEQRFGFCADGRNVLVESMPNPLFVRYMIVDNTGYDFLRRPINRHWLRMWLTQAGINPAAVDWCDPLPATRENNVLHGVVDDFPWEYPGDPATSAPRSLDDMVRGAIDILEDDSVPPLDRAADAMDYTDDLQRLAKLRIGHLRSELDSATDIPILARIAKEAGEIQTLMAHYTILLQRCGGQMLMEPASELMEVGQ